MSRRDHFTHQLEQAAGACGAQLRWLSDGWVAQLTKDGRRRRVIGYTFPLNDAVAAQIANDKVATYAVLFDNQVPAIMHRILRPSDLPADAHSAAALDAVPLPLVAKPNEGRSGMHVLRARDQAELHEAMRFLAQRYRAVALSPYVEIAHEYRVVVLDEVVRIVVEKHRQADWRHNLCFGATSRLVDAADVVAAVTVLAQRAMTALDLRFASVDLVDVAGELAVLEINSAVTLERFSAQAREHAQLARDVYRDAVAACFSVHRGDTGWRE